MMGIIQELRTLCMVRGNMQHYILTDNMRGLLTLLRLKVHPCSMRRQRIRHDSEPCPNLQEYFMKLSGLD